jgi:hypothetical protein
MMLLTPTTSLSLGGVGAEISYATSNSWSVQECGYLNSPLLNLTTVTSQHSMVLYGGGGSGNTNKVGI